MAQIAFTDDQLSRLYSAANNAVHMSAGQGRLDNQLQNMFRNLNHFGPNDMSSNVERVGLTFITRPKLNLTSTSLRQNRVLTLLDTMDNYSVPFMIRCLLDTKLAREHEVFRQLVAESPLMDYRNPFLIPLSNALLGISGFPDIVLDTETSTAGFFSEDYTFVKGHDDLSKTYDLTLEFKDVTGGPIMALLHTWILYMALVARGDVVAYPEDIDAIRLNYTVSIYRFVFDPTLSIITKWAKATGCFPSTLPIGAAFNFSEGQSYVDDAAKFSISFKANKIRYNDHIIFRQFNTLVKRYWPDVESSRVVAAPMTPGMNYVGIPYINSKDGVYNRLEFRHYPDEVDTEFDDVVQELSDVRGSNR